MKLIRYLVGEKVCHGVVSGDIIKVGSGNFYGDFKLTSKTIKLEDVIILPPVKPSKIIAVGRNYMLHIKEFDNVVPANPVLFPKLPQTIIAHNEEILLPKTSPSKVEFEGECAVVIKKYCKRVKKSHAHDYILGVTCLNDVTERVIQKSDGQWMRGKNFETFCPVGPWIETESDYNNLKISTKLNGEIRQNSNTSNMIWNICELIEFISASIYLEPGDVISTGTPEGVGELKAGDTVEITIEGVGTLKNTVALA